MTARADSTHVAPVVGDSREITVTVGAGSTNLTGTGFTALDNGKTIAIAGAGTAGGTLITTVTYVSATQLTLAAPAVGAVTGVNAAIGTDDTAAWWATRDAVFSAQEIRMHKPAGPVGFSSLVTAPIPLTHPDINFVGDSQHGAVIHFAGTGALFENGTDNGHAYDANDYDGNESLRVRRMTLKAVARKTALDNGVGSYAPGTLAIRDWRGGDIQLEDVRVEGFDTGFWGIQSDLNSWHNVIFVANNLGAYVGPRSDQLRVTGNSYFIWNNRALDIDGAQGGLYDGVAFVNNGTATINGIRVRSQWTRGSRANVFDRCWFEHYLGVATIEAFIEIGVGDTYQSLGLEVNTPFILTNGTGSAGHTKYFIKTGNCNDVYVRNPRGVDAGPIDSLFYHVDTTVVPRLFAETQRESSTSGVMKVTLGPGAATPSFLRVSIGGGLWTVGDYGAGAGRNQIDILPNSNFPQINWRFNDGTNVWTQQVGLTNAQMLLISRLNNGEFHIQDSGGGDQLKMADGASAGVRYITLGHASGKVGFYGAVGAVKQTISGSRGGNAALADLLTKLASLGFITDSTTA